jgi:hypothetical protein
MDPMGQTQLQGQTGGLPPYEYGPPETGVRPRRKKKVWPWVAAVLALAVIGGGIAAYELVNSTGSQVAVPSDLQGMTVPKAVKAVKQAHLQARPVKHKSLNGPYNVVTRTNPSGGTKVAKGSTVTLNYNVKPGAQTLPDVSGLSVSDATAQLSKAGWKNVITSASPVASLKFKNGDVVSTNRRPVRRFRWTRRSCSTCPAAVSRCYSGRAVAGRCPGQVEPGWPDLPDHPASAAGTTPGTVWKSSPSRGKAVLPNGS